MPGKRVRQVEPGVKTSGDGGRFEDVLTMEVRALRMRGLARDSIEMDFPQTRTFHEGRTWWQYQVSQGVVVWPMASQEQCRWALPWCGEVQCQGWAAVELTVVVSENK